MEHIRDKRGTAMTSQTLRGRATGFTTGAEQPSLRQRFSNVVRYNKIMDLLVRRDLKVRYAGSVLGYLWTVLDPLLMSLVYFYVFTQIFHRSASGYDAYMLFLITGQLPWFWFNGGVTNTARALRSEAAMIRSTPVPREVWILRVILSKGVEYIFGLPVILIFAIAYMKAPTIYTLLLPLGWALEFVLLFGFGLLLAPLTVLYRDVERLIPVFLRVFFFASPVLYSIQQVPQTLRTLMPYNPAVGWLQISRGVFYKQAINWSYIWNSALGTLVVFAIGLFVFTRLERQVLKEI